MSLYDDPEPGPEAAQPRAKRGRLTKPEQWQSNIDLKDAITSGSDDLLRRSLALSLYRLGAEPLNKLAVDMLKLLEGEV